MSNTTCELNFLLSVIHDLVDPVEIVRDARVDARHVRLAATDAPGDDAGQLPAALTLADHRATAVALAGILALLAAGADEARMEVEAGPQPRPSHLLLAHLVADDRYVHLLQYILKFAVVAEGVLAPSGGPTSCSGEIVVFIRQTGGANVRMRSEIDVMVQLQNSDVVGKSAGVEFRMHEDAHDVALDVGIEFNVMTHVPFA